MDNISTTTRTILMSIAGGTASVLGGGKFSNGALSSAFIFMFNDLAIQNTKSIHGWHRRIVLLDKDGNIKYGISFGLPRGFKDLNILGFGKGVVEVDMSKKAIKNVSYLKTTEEEDKLMISYLKSQVGQTHTYSILLYNCRTYAYEQFNYMRKFLGR